MVRFSREMKPAGGFHPPPPPPAPGLKMPEFRGGTRFSGNLDADRCAWRAAGDLTCLANLAWAISAAAVKISFALPRGGAFSPRQRGSAADLAWGNGKFAGRD